MEMMIECIHVPARPDLDPAKVVTVFEEPYGPDSGSEFERYTELGKFLDALEDLRVALAAEIGVEREHLPDEGTFFRINIRV